ncbi:MAG: transporter, partial [Thermoanaerobaculia bacterium]
LNVSRLVTVIAGLAQIGVGIALQYEQRSALSTALAVASLINGPILGVFFLGATRRGGTPAALAGMTAGLLAVLAVWLGTPVAWPWYTVVGSITTFVIGWLVAGSRPSQQERIA